LGRGERQIGPGYCLRSAKPFGPGWLHFKKQTGRRRRCRGLIDDCHPLDRGNISDLIGYPYNRMHRLTRLADTPGIRDRFYGRLARWLGSRREPAWPTPGYLVQIQESESASHCRPRHSRPVAGSQSTEQLTILVGRLVLVDISLSDLERGPGFSSPDALREPALSGEGGRQP